MSKDSIAKIKEFIENSGSLTKAALELGTSRRSLARYRDGQVDMPDELKEKMVLNDIEEISDTQLVADYIERYESLTTAALALGTSRRSLARYRDGEVALPEAFKEVMFNDRQTSMIPETNIPVTMPKSLEDGNVLYFGAKVPYENSWGEESVMPIITIAHSVDYADASRDYIVINGADDCVVLVNAEKARDIVAEYKSENDRDVQYYRNMAMKFETENSAYVLAQVYPELVQDIKQSDIEELVKNGSFNGTEKSDISFIVLDKENSELYLALMQEKILENVRSNENVHSLDF